MSIPPFWGDVGVKKWSPFLDSGTQSTVFWYPKLGTFAKSGCFQVPKNGTSGAQNKKTETTSSCQHPPKMVDKAFVLCVYHFWMGFKPISKNCTF